MSFTIRLTKLEAWMERKKIRRREDLASTTKLSIATVNKILAQKRVSQSTVTQLAHYTKISEQDLVVLDSSASEQRRFGG